MGGAAAKHSAMEKLTASPREAPAWAANPAETCKALSVLPVWEVFQLRMQKHLLRSHVNCSTLLSSPGSISAPTRGVQIALRALFTSRSPKVIHRWFVFKAKHNAPQVPNVEFQMCRFMAWNKTRLITHSFS